MRISPMPKDFRVQGGRIRTLAIARQATVLTDLDAATFEVRKQVRGLPLVRKLFLAPDGFSVGYRQPCPQGTPAELHFIDPDLYFAGSFRLANGCTGFSHQKHQWIVACRDGALHSFDESGAPLWTWSIPLHHRFTSPFHVAGLRGNFQMAARIGSVKSSRRAARTLFYSIRLTSGSTFSVTTAPHATVINAVDGAVLGTIDLGGMPEQAVTDGAGHVYVDIRDKDNVAVIDAKTLTASAHYDLGGKGGRCSGLAIDVKNHILFAACREPQTMVMLNAGNGKIIDALPIGSGVDSAIFNPKTMETYSAQVDGTLTVVKEKSPTSFVVEQTVKTKESAKQMVWDTKTNRILLIAADYDPAPSPAPVGAPAGRGPMVPDSFSVQVVSK
jgi:hypothetical protein